MTRLAVNQLDFIDETLKALLFDLESYDGEQVITSLYRINDNGVHGTLPLRGMDVRCRDADKGADLEEYLNSRWQYDTQRPDKVVCIFHDVGMGAHLHLQVHPNTEKAYGNSDYS